MECGTHWLALAAALDRGERGPVAEVVAEALAAGATPEQLARRCWSWALDRGGLETRGARWSHALLALAAASAIDSRLGPELGEAAIVNAIDFLSCARPSRVGGQEVPADRWQDPSSWCASLRRDAMAQADGQLVDLLGRPDSGDELATAWFQAGSMTSSGWGHRAIGARSFWAVADAALASREPLLRAGLRLWLPFEATRGLQPALQRWAASGLSAPLVGDGSPGWRPVLGSGRLEPVCGDPAEAALLSQAILEGRGDQAFLQALLAGTPPPVLAAAACTAACRVFVARPGLRQVHGVTFSRAILDVVQVMGVDVRAPLWLAQDFVAESWSMALRSGRVRHSGQALGQTSPPPTTVESRASAIRAACRVEATAAFGHTLKLCETCLDLECSLPKGLSGWAVAALVAAEPTWPRGQRPWLATRRTEDQGSSSSLPHV